MSATPAPLPPGMYPDGLYRDVAYVATLADTPNPFLIIALGHPVLDDVALRELAAWIRSWSRRQKARALASSAQETVQPQGVTP